MLWGMAVEFRQVTCPPLTAFEAVAPDGAVIGIIGEDDAGGSTLLRLAAGLETPQGGAVAVGTKRRLIGPTEPPNLAAVDTPLLAYTFTLHYPLVLARAAAAISRLPRAG